MTEPSSDANATQTRLRSGWKRATKWFFLTGDRLSIAVGLVVVLGCFFGILVWFGLVPIRNTQALFYAYSGLISGNLTLITVVASINQLLLSRELNTPGEHRTQMEHVIEYRTEIEEATDTEVLTDGGDEA